MPFGDYGSVIMFRYLRVEILGLLNADGTENPALVVYRRDGDKVRLFWSSAMKLAMADPGQDPRDAPDIAALWNILDLTPEGRGTDWYPKLEYQL